MAKLKIKQPVQYTQALVLEPQDEDLLAVLKFTAQTLREDAAILNDPRCKTDEDADLTARRLREAAKAIKAVLPYYTVGGGQVE